MKWLGMCGWICWVFYYVVGREWYFYGNLYFWRSEKVLFSVIDIVREWIVSFELMYIFFGCFLSKMRGNVYRYFVKYFEYVDYGYCGDVVWYVEDGIVGYFDWLNKIMCFMIINNVKRIKYK